MPHGWACLCARNPVERTAAGTVVHDRRRLELCHVARFGGKPVDGAPKPVEPTVKAAILDGPNAPFRVDEVPRPTATAGHVLVRVHASGVNPLDTKISAGAAPHARHPLP